MASIVSGFLVDCTQFKAGLTCVNNTQGVYEILCQKNSTSQRMSLKTNLHLRYPDS